MRAPPPALPATANLADLVDRMADSDNSSVLVVGDQGRLVGLVTAKDVATRLTLQRDGQKSIRTVMTSPVQAIGVDVPLYRAVAQMRRTGRRRLPVVDGENRPVGLLDLGDALTLAVEPLVRGLDGLRAEKTLESLRHIRAAQVDLAEALLQDRGAAADVQALLTDINRDLHRQVIQRALAAMADDGWGAPPVPFAAIIMGSGGRGENFLRPDQDNGFILEDYPDSAHARIDPYFIELASRMVDDLHAVGIPYCPGHVMATNPLWRKTRSQWRRQVRLWGRKRNLIAVRQADIFFDFQAVYGEAALAQELRRSVTGLTKNNPAFIRAMHSEEAPHLGVALGLFGSLRTEKAARAREKRVNLKLSGSLPLVQSVRLLALREGLSETGTLDRIEALHERRVLDRNERDSLTGAFDLIATLLLRGQIADVRAGREPGSQVPLEDLTPWHRDLLVSSLKAIAALGKRIHIELTGEIFS